MSKTTAEIAQLIQGKLIGDGNIPITGITNVEAPGPGLITFVENPKYLKKLEETDIACLIVPPTIEKSTKPLIQFPLPKLAWAKLLDLFYPTEAFTPGISKQASVANSATIGTNVTIEPFAVIGEGAKIGDDSIIRSHAVVGKKVEVGTKTHLHPSVVIYDGCKIGNSVILHSGTIIGTDGFGYVHTPDAQEKVPQVGNVIIEDDVEIGANSTIDCATIGSTIIGKGCKIDNLVQIAHNVVLGPHTVISSQTGISGSCKVGSHVTMGGKAGLGDHVEIGDWTMVGAGAGFPSGKKVPGKQIVFGQPARPYQEARRQIGAQLRSAETLEEVRRLKKKVQALEEQIQKSEPSKS